MKLKKSPTLAAVKICCRVLDEKKAEDLKVLDVSEQSSITDYLVVATATSLPHLRALRVELEKALDAANTHLVGMESSEESGWLVIDAFAASQARGVARPARCARRGDARRTDHGPPGRALAG